MREQIRGGSLSVSVFVITHEYVGKGGSEKKDHFQAFNLLIVDAGKEEKRVEYGVFEEKSERLLSEVLDRLVSAE